MNIFEQTIFPSVEKIQGESTHHDMLVLGLDYWFVHGVEVVLHYVKCPLCGFEYVYCRFQSLVDTDNIAKTISENENHFYAEFIRECPRKEDEHYAVDIWTRLSK